MDDISVIIPMSRLVALLEAQAGIEDMKNQFSQMRREIDGLRRIQSETLQLIADNKRGKNA